MLEVHIHRGIRHAFTKVCHQLVAPAVEEKRHLSRKSFALYYYTATRPADELGDEHSTIYVEEHLPENLEAGMTLEARLSWYGNELAQNGLEFSRTTAELGLRAAL